MDYYQKTVANKILFSGKGLHSGRIVHLEIFPAAANTGIVFQRTDSNSASPVLASALNISSTELSTTIGMGSSSVSTIEHLMAAFSGLGIDNAFVKLNAPEVPIMDGSSLPFITKIQEVGYRIQAAHKKFMLVKQPLEIRSGDQYIKVTPSIKQSIKCSIEFNDRVIGTQSISYESHSEDFTRIANARTFCNLKDVKLMQEHGLALGGSLNNAVVVTDTGVLNRDGLRSENEFVKHKLLDLIGDLYLLGGELVGEIEVHKPGHTLHACLTRKLWQDREEYLSVVEVGSFRSSHPKEKKGFLVPAIAYG